MRSTLYTGLVKWPFERTMSKCKIGEIEETQFSLASSPLLLLEGTSKWTNPD